MVGEGVGVLGGLVVGEGVGVLGVTLGDGEGVASQGSV